MLDGRPERVQSWADLIARLTLSLGLLCAPAAFAATDDAWFTGSLEAPGATVNAPGQLSVEPSFGISNGRSSYGQNGQLVATRHPDVSLNPQLLLELGVADRLQLSLSGQAVWNRDDGDWSNGFGDTQLGVNIALLDENPETLAPAVRLDLELTLPTGEYQRLDADTGGSDATGSGSYVTTLLLNTAKTFQIGEHQIRPHACIAVDLYTSNVRVNSVNAYGGGPGASGTVTPGRTVTGYLSVEYALTQRWALALGAIYTRGQRTTFRGDPGVQPGGEPSAVGNGRTQLLTLAPALEYSWSAERGVILGMTFDLSGENASQATGLQIEYTHTFDAF